jgi:hypothetical protein
MSPALCSFPHNSPLPSYLKRGEIVPLYYLKRGEIVPLYYLKRGEIFSSIIFKRGDVFSPLSLRGRTFSSSP